jgi:hypothetical protein
MNLQALALAIAPELSAAPLYIVQIPTNDNLAGFCTRRVEAAFRQQLVAAGDWRGPGTLIAIAENQDQTDPDWPAGILLHELGHALPFSPPREDDYTAADVEHAERLLSAFVDMPAGPPARCPGHGLDFLRTVCHLHYRAAQRGVEVAYPAIIQAAYYRLPPLVYFSRALGSEPAEMATLPFSQILSLPAPTAFTALYER